MNTLQTLRSPEVIFSYDHVQPGRPWTTSFFLALGFHLLLIFGSGSFGFYNKADFGLRGSSGSMEITMIAALPDYTSNPSSAKKTPVSPEPFQDKNSTVLQEPAPETRTIDTRRKSTRRGARSEVKGDGSSPVPGQNETTFFSAGSAEAAAREGRFKNPPPQYPARAQELGQEGLVVLRTRVNKDGRPFTVEIRKSSGYTLLDREARRAVRKWRFEPAHLGPVSIESSIDIPIRFSLTEN